MPIESPYKEKVPDEIAMTLAPGFSHDELLNAAGKLMLTVSQRPKSIVEEVRIYRKYVPIMIKAYCTQSEGMKKAAMQIDRLADVEYDRGNKRWSKEEDEMLINLVCEGKENIHKISTILGRSPGAIQSHISFLVGRKRLTQEVAGKFIGTINGESTEAEICGTVYK